MKKLIMTKGLPGCGKSTWAYQYLEKNPNTLLVCKDDLRAMMFNSAWTVNREKIILKVRDFIISTGLESGRDVVVHDTNFAPKHEIRLKELAKTHKAEFIVQDFTHIPIEQCIKQDLLRPDSVGEKVIREMYSDWLKPKPAEYSFNAGLPFAIICDLDGTLALFGDKNPYERDFINDTVNTPVHELLIQHKRKYKIVLVSGRKDTFRKETEEWLEKYGIEYDHLFMRKGDDTRKDFVIKREIFEKEIRDKFNIWMVLDDRNQVVELWRSLGLTCLQVAEGNF